MLQRPFHKDIPRFDPATNWSVEFDGLLKWVNWVVDEETTEATKRVRTLSGEIGHDDHDHIPAAEAIVPVFPDQENTQADSSSGSSSTEEEAT